MSQVFCSRLRLLLSTNLARGLCRQYEEGRCLCERIVPLPWHGGSLHPAGGFAAAKSGAALSKLMWSKGTLAERLALSAILRFKLLGDITFNRIPEGLAFNPIKLHKTFGRVDLDVQCAPVVTFLNPVLMPFWSLQNLVSEGVLVQDDTLRITGAMRGETPEALSANFDFTKTSFRTGIGKAPFPGVTVSGFAKATANHPASEWGFLGPVTVEGTVDVMVKADKLFSGIYTGPQIRSLVKDVLWKYPTVVDMLKERLLAMNPECSVSVTVRNPGVTLKGFHFQPSAIKRIHLVSVIDKDTLSKGAISGEASVDVDIRPPPIAPQTQRALDLSVLSSRNPRVIVPYLGVKALYTVLTIKGRFTTTVPFSVPFPPQVKGPDTQ